MFNFFILSSVWNTRFRVFSDHTDYPRELKLIGKERIMGYHHMSWLKKEPTLVLRVCLYMTVRSWTNVWRTTFHYLVVPFGTGGMVQVDRPLVLVPLVPRISKDPLLLVPLVPRLQLVPTCPIWLYHLSCANSFFPDYFLGFSVSFHFSKNTIKW